MKVYVCYEVTNDIYNNCYNTVIKVVAKESQAISWTQEELDYVSIRSYEEYEVEVCKITDEELEKKAEEYVKENMDCCRTDNSVNQSIPYFSEEERCIAKSAYKAGAKHE